MGQPELIRGGGHFDVASDFQWFDAAAWYFEEILDFEGMQNSLYSLLNLVEAYFCVSS